jgi:iron complex outermembrane recepter protein
MNYKTTACYFALATALGIGAAAARAADNVDIESGNGSDGGTETVVVTGFKQSLNAAEKLKKQATNVSETILAEDIANFPEQNLAEALQRIPGVAISRDGAEGRGITIHGLGTDFVQVEINGMEALSSSSSAMDARGAVNRSRGFDFDIFASELFSRVDVYKSFSANGDEGGLAGTVNLHTAHPFDYDGFKFAINAQGTRNSQTTDVTPRISTLISDRWGSFGILASVAYSNNKLSEIGYDTVRWRRVNSSGATISALSAADQTLINNKSIWFPRSARPVIFDNNQTRIGATLAVEYRPSDNLRFSIDALYGKNHNDRLETHMQLTAGSSTGLGCTTYKSKKYCATVKQIEYNDNKEVTYLSLENATLNSESKIEDAITRIDQLVFNAEWDITDKLHLKGLAGHESSNFDNNQAKVYMLAFSDMTIDFTKRRFSGLNSYAADLTKSTNFHYFDNDRWQPAMDHIFDTVKTDLSYDFADTSSLKAGASFRRYSYKYGVIEVANVNKAAWNAGTLDDTVDQNLTFLSKAQGDNTWLSVDVEAVYKALGIKRYLAGPAMTSTVQEQTYAGYLQYDFSGIDVGIGTLRGDAGVRYYSTTTTAGDMVNSTYVEIPRSYDGFLPALNLAWDPIENAVVRFAVSRNVTRASLGSLSPSGTIQNNVTAGDLTISAGNPGLKPLKSTNVDFAVEYYFPQGGYVSAAYFYKAMSNLIGSSTVEIAFGKTGYPLSFLGTVDANGNAQTASTIYKYSMPVNVGDADVQGFEVGLQRDFDFLPKPFDKFGLNASYTYADGTTPCPNVYSTGVTENKLFSGMSKNSANLTLYYDTKSWGARLSAAFRSKFNTSTASGNSDEDERGFHGSTFVDFSAFYNINDNLKLTLKGMNLGGQRMEFYTSSSDRLYSNTTIGTTISVGATYKF